MLMVTMQRLEPHSAGVGLKIVNKKSTEFVTVDMAYFNFFGTKYRITVGAVVFSMPKFLLESPNLELLGANIFCTLGGQAAPAQALGCLQRASHSARQGKMATVGAL
jgi:hypothetical protein